MKKSLIFVQGYPGSGKSTLCRWAVHDRNVEGWAGKSTASHLSVGGHVRSILQGELPTKFSDEVRGAKEDITHLRLPDPKLIFALVDEALELKPEELVLIDGFPRDMVLVEMLRQYEEKHAKILGNIVVEVEPKVAIERQMQRVSQDGHPVADTSTVLRRIREYDTDTMPVIEAVGEIWGGDRIDGNPCLDMTAVDFAAALKRTILRDN